MALGLFDGAGRMRYRSRHTRGLADVLRELRREAFWRDVEFWAVRLAPIIAAGMLVGMWLR